ncbi:MAG: winged helix-turn-helix transcriptional regulator [Flavobacteriaceae bacterium]
MVNALDILGDKWSLVVVRDIFNGKKSFGEFLASPEKISTSVLTSRLQLLERSGIAQHVLSKSDKKVKLYYLTDRGIDLFPILYEMIYWSKRNLDQEFHLLSKDWFKRYETFTPEETILENQNDYKSKREKLLEVQ